MSMQNKSTAAYVASLVISPSEATLYNLTGYNAKASAQFIQLHDSATLPADTAVPKVVITVAASSNFSIPLNSYYGRTFNNGIVVCNSSTGATKTIGTTDCFFDAQVIIQ